MAGIRSGVKEIDQSAGVGRKEDQDDSDLADTDDWREILLPAAR